MTGEVKNEPGIHKFGLADIRHTILDVLMGLFTGKYLPGCCWCLKGADDAIPFWTHDSSDDTIVNSSANEDYTNETFESGTEATQTRTQTQTAAAAAAAAKHSPSRDGTASYGGTGSQSRLSKLAKQKGLDLKGPKSPLRSPGAKDGRKGSESESDDSFSVPYSAETVSDQSDVEGRIRALSDELQRRKMEAERLRQEKKKKEKEKLKEQEKHLKKKIEDYDMYITQMQSEISEEDQEAVVNGVQPVIRHPGGTAASTAESKKHKQQQQQRESAGEASPVAVEGKPQTPPASKKSSLGRIEEDRPRKMQRDTLEISEDIPTDVVTAADSEAESGLNLKLQLDRDDGEVDRGTTPTPRSGVTDARGQDTARSLSEIPEEYTQSVQSARSETDVPSFKGESARSAYTEDSESRSERSESSQQSRSTVSTESKSYSDDFSGSSSTTVEASGPVESSKRDLVLKEKEKSVTEQEESIAESIQTEGGISDIESDADKELYIDLKAGEAPEVQQEGSLIDPLAQFQIGDRVLVRGGCAGWLRFKGRTQFAEGFWAGVELDKAEGSTNGTRDAVEYFACRESHGTFVPASDIQRLPDNFQTEESTAQMREESSVVEDFSAATDSGLLQITKDVVPPVSTTTKTPHANESLVNKLTEELMQGVIEDSVDTMQNIRAKSPVDVLEVSPEAENVADRAGGSTKQKEQASEVVTQNLFNEAITQMLNIRKRKKDSVQQTEDLVDASADKQPRTTDDSVDVSADSKAGSSSKAESEASDGGGLLGSLPPLAGNKDAGVVSESELEEIYKSFQEPSDWWDDDDPLGAAVKPPPPYQEPAGSGQQEASGPFMRKDLKLELDRLTEVFYVVPHSEAEANDLADKAVDIFWELRRYGESWDDVEIPDGYFSPRDRNVDMEGRSRKAYKKLVFDLTAEILREMYKEELEEEEEVQPWTRNKPAKRKYHRDQAPPTTCEVLKPIVRAHVSKYLGLEPKAGQKLGKWTGRRKKDRVDQLLVQELREEEPEWVNYDRDEVAVKMQLVDTIFESLLQETVTVIGNIYSRRNDWDETQD